MPLFPSFPRAATRALVLGSIGVAFSLAAQNAEAGRKHKKEAAPSAPPPTKLAKAKGKTEKGCAAEILVDLESGKVVYADNPDKSIHPASAIKLIAAMAAEDAINQGNLKPDTIIDTPLYKNRSGDFSPHAYVCDSTKEHLVKHKTITASVIDTIRNVVVASYNAAAHALGAITPKQIETILTKFGLTQTHITETAGISNASNCKGDENTSTVRDLAKLAGNIPHYPLVQESLRGESVTINGVPYKNTNKLLPQDIIGKTGTVRAGTSFAGIATMQDGRTLAVAVAECPHGGGHFKAVKQLLAAHAAPTDYKELAKAYNLKPAL